MVFLSFFLTQAKLEKFFIFLNSWILLFLRKICVMFFFLVFEKIGFKVIWYTNFITFGNVLNLRLSNLTNNNFFFIREKQKNKENKGKYFLIRELGLI
jgi:hypothetical protein